MITVHDSLLAETIYYFNSAFPKIHQAQRSIRENSNSTMIFSSFKNIFMNTFDKVDHLKSNAAQEDLALQQQCKIQSLMYCLSFFTLQIFKSFLQSIQPATGVEILTKLNLQTLSFLAYCHPNILVPFNVFFFFYRFQASHFLR